MLIAISVIHAIRTKKDIRDRSFDNAITRGQNVLSMRSRDTFHIVVTDINHNVRDFLQRELEKEGYTVASVKTGTIAYERIFSLLPLDLIILDPELFDCVEQSFIEEIVRRRPLLQIIIHTYADSIPLVQSGHTVNIVEKNGQSIGSIKSIIHASFTHFQEKHSPDPLTSIV